MTRIDSALAAARAFVERSSSLQARYRAGDVHVHVPGTLAAQERHLDELLSELCPASTKALDAASQSLFFSLPLAFDPGESVGPYLATIDRDERGEPYRFLDLGALIATQAFGENDPTILAAVLEGLPYVVGRYAHSEYQTELSLRLKASLDSIAPRGTPRHFVVNTGAEAVENGMKSVLLNRVRSAPTGESGFFVVSFDGAFHGRTLGCLAVTQRKKARAGFPTFDWPHVPFPFDEPHAPEETRRREDKSLRILWDLIVTGRQPNVARSREAYRRDVETIDALLAAPRAEVLARLAEARGERRTTSPDTLRRARRMAGVLIEPIQGEGGVRTASARFFQRLRVLTKLYDIPLMLDEVQAGWGAAGARWAHELFDLPFPPDVVCWAKKAQNGVLFVSEELATFFHEEKKFNTTWEGDSVGMLRLLSVIDQLDLEQVRRTGALVRDGLMALEKEFSPLLHGVRGSGCMLAFDVVRPDVRDALRDRAFRRGLILLPAGERTLRFYPRYDMEPYAIDEALAILRSAAGDLLGSQAPAHVSLAPERRVGPVDVPRSRVGYVIADCGAFDAVKGEVSHIERERYGSLAQYPPEPLRSGKLPLLQYPIETLDATMGNPRSVCVALRDMASQTLVAYALGSPLENHDEEGVRDDPHFGDGSTFYLQAMAVLPSVRNYGELETLLLLALRDRVQALGFQHLSTLIEARVRDNGPKWFRHGVELRTVDDYLGSGLRFVYVSTRIAPGHSEPIP